METHSLACGNHSSVSGRVYYAGKGFKQRGKDRNGFHERVFLSESSGDGGCQG